MNNDEDNERAEEYYNCGYDGCYKPKEKAIIFECVGRGLKLPLLSQIYVPPILLMGRQNHTEGIMPSQHVLELLSLEEASPQDSNLTEGQMNELQSSPKDCPESNGDGHSELSDLDLYISDEDGTTVERDCHPGVKKFQAQNSSKKETFLPINLVCKAECTPSGNRVVTEVDSATNALSEKGDSVTSDEEIFSNPSYGEDSESDNEEVSVATNNLNMTNSCETKPNNSTNNLNTTTNGSGQNISLDKDLSVSNNSVLKFGDSFQKNKHVSDHSSSPRELRVKENIGSEIDGRRESSSSNSYRDPVADMFSSDESEKDYFVTHFRTFKKDLKLSVDSTIEFPGLPTKPEQEQNSQKKYQVERVPENQLKIKNIARLLLSGPSDTHASVKSDCFEDDHRDLKPSCPELLIIENLPQNVNKEILGNFLQQFGEIKHTTLIPLPERITARIEYEIGVDLDWVVECLDGSHIFGVESPVLRCYHE